jgi:hypothetical protein
MCSNLLFGGVGTGWNKIKNYGNNIKTPELVYYVKKSVPTSSNDHTNPQYYNTCKNSVKTKSLYNCKYLHVP